MSFPKYEHYKDSGVEWLGEVPAHWDLKPLKHLVDFRSGGTPDKTNREFWDGEVPWASAKDLKTDELFDTIDHITETAVSAGAASLVEPGSILVVVRGMILARLFPVVTARVPMAINQDLKALSVKPQIHPDFMAWMLRGSEAETLSRLDEAGHGTKALRMEAWGAMRLPVPDLSEQVRIVDFLKVETTKLDGLITEQRTLIDLLKEKRQAVISHAVTKGLDPRVPMKDSGVEWLGEVPAHWEVAAVNYRYEVLLGKMLDEKRITGNHLAPYLRNVDVQWDRINTDDLPSMDFSGDDLNRFSLIDGDLLVCEGGEVGRAAIWNGPLQECYYQKALHRLRRKNEQSDTSRFMFYVLRMATSLGVFDASGGKSTIAHLPAEALRRFRFAYPPKREQDAIIDYLDAEKTRLDALTAEAQTTIALLQERRSALISAAVTGKIDVRGRALKEEIMTKPA